MEKQKRTGRKRRGRRRKKGFGDILSTIVLIVALGTLVYSGYNLFPIVKGYHEGNVEYRELENLAITLDEEDNRFRVNFEELWEVNPDIKAWIRFDEPEIISYPVVQGKDNEEYLTKTISGYENTYGAIFMDVADRPNFEDTQTIIYGHRMKSGSMFARLDKYSSKEFWDQYPIFYIYTPDGAELRYQIFATGTIHEMAEMYNSSFNTNEETLKFMEYCKSIAEYDTGVNVELGDKIVVLSTCTSASDENRYVVCGVLTEVRK